jgi:hypothetical protein
MDATRRGNRLLTLTLIFISGISWFCQEMQSTAQAADGSSEATSVKPLDEMTLLTHLHHPASFSGESLVCLCRSDIYRSLIRDPSSTID